MKDRLAELRAEVALACRVLAARDLAPGFLGHVSARVDEALLLVRCRGPHERGLAWTDAAEYGSSISRAPQGELDGDYTVPNGCRSTPRCCEPAPM